MPINTIRRSLAVRALATLGSALFFAMAGQAHAGAWCPADRPCEPVLAGIENGQQRLVCRAHYENGIHPGKTVAGRCNISYGGKEYPMDHFEILYARGYWAKAPHGPDSQPLVAGHENDGTPLVLCRAFYNGATHPGKIVAGNCNIAWGGNEIVLQDYETYFEVP